MIEWIKTQDFLSDKSVNWWIYNSVLNGEVHEWLIGWLDEGFNKGMDGWINEWLDEWRDKISMNGYSISCWYSGTTLVNTFAGFALQVDPSNLAAHLTPAGTFLDAAGAVQEAYCPASPGSPVQPVQVFSVGDQLPQHILPGAGTTHIPGPLQLGSLEASYQLDSGTFPNMHAGMTQLSGYHANSSTEPVVVVPEYQPHQYQQHQYPGQQGHWYSQACSMTRNWSHQPGMHLNDLPSQPVKFVADHVAEINGYGTREETAGSPCAQAAITNADHSAVVHEGTSCTNELPEVSCQVLQQPSAAGAAQVAFCQESSGRPVKSVETPGGQAIMTNAHHSAVVHKGTSCTNELPQVSRRVPQQPSPASAAGAAEMANFCHESPGSPIKPVETPGAQATIMNTHHSAVVHKGTSCINELPEVSRRVPQQSTVSAPAQQGARKSDDDQAVVVIEDRSTPGLIRLHFVPKVAVQPSLPSNHAAQISPLNVSTNSRLEQQVEPVKSVKESHPTRFDKHYPVAGARCDAEAVSRCCSSVARGPHGAAVAGECQRDLHDAEIPENILASFSVGMPSFLQTLTAASVAEELEKIDNPNKPSRDMQRDEQVFPASYHTPDSLALSLRGTQQAPCATTGVGVFCSLLPGISNDNKCKTDDDIEITYDSTDNRSKTEDDDILITYDSTDNRSKTEDDDIEITYDSTDACFYSASAAQDERVSRKLVKMLNPPDLAEFNSDIGLDKDGMNHFAELSPLMSSRDILTSGSPPSRAIWETEEVIKLMSVSLESDHKRVRGMVTQYVACPDEKRPLASTLSPPTTGSKLAKKRKLSELHEVLLDSPPESDSSEPNHKKCCFREGGLGELRRVHSGPSTGDLTKPCARFLDRRDGLYKQGKYAKKLKASKERKSIWA